MNTQTFYKLSYGLYIVSSKMDDRFNGQIANTVFQITWDPPVIAVSINKENLTHEFIIASRVFTVSILSKETPLKFIGRFGFRSGRDLDKFEGVEYKIGITGVPIVTEHCVGYLEAKLVSDVDVDTHTLFIGTVINAEILRDVEPMTYAYYREIKRGKVPKTAPTYVSAP